MVANTLTGKREDIDIRCSLVVHSLDVCRRCVVVVVGQEDVVDIDVAGTVRPKTDDVDVAGINRFSAIVARGVGSGLQIDDQLLLAAETRR